jgi:hypothetical protein
VALKIMQKIQKKKIRKITKFPRKKLLKQLPEREGRPPYIFYFESPDWLNSNTVFYFLYRPAL